jgi:hypothetical protein
MKAADSSHDSFMLEVDGGTCYNVGKNSSMPMNTWTWVAYQNGSTSSYIDVPLTVGTHTVKMIGTSSNVQLDRVIATSDTSCVPTGDGSNCIVLPGPKLGTITPANGATVSGTTVSMSALVDTGGSPIDHVNFYMDNVVIVPDGSQYNAPYSFKWDSTTVPNGAHQYKIVAYDAAGLTDTTTYTINVKNGDTISPTVSITSPTDGATITGSHSFVATASDNVGIAKVVFTVDGSTVIGTQVNAPYSFSWDTTALANGSHTLTAKAYDAAGNTASDTINFTTSN